MAKDPTLYCATDKEIHDLLMSGKRKITETVMLGLAKDRGILYSTNETRETLAHRLSLLPHGFHDLNVLVEQRELTSRGEKTTSIILPTLSVDEIKAVSAAFQDDAQGDEKVTTLQHGKEAYEVRVAYSEIDYSKTRLIQRRKRDASIEFEFKEDRTIVRLPATPKAQEVVEDLRRRIEEARKTEVAAVRIELSSLLDAEARTSFFTRLITKLPQFTVSNVTSVKVESSNFEEESDDDEDADVQEAQVELLSAVQNAAFRGQSLLSTDVYQRLRDGGFFITSIIWDAQELTTHSIYQFEAAFDEPKAGKGFKYNVRGVRLYENGRHMKTFRAVEEGQKQYLFELIEGTAASVLEGLQQEQQQKVTAAGSAMDEADGANAA